MGSCRWFGVGGRLGWRDVRAVREQPNTRTGGYPHRDARFPSARERRWDTPCPPCPVTFIGPLYLGEGRGSRNNFLEEIDGGMLSECRMIRECEIFHAGLTSSTTTNENSERTTLHHFCRALFSKESGKSRSLHDQKELYRDVGGVASALGSSCWCCLVRVGCSGSIRGLDVQQDIHISVLRRHG